MSLPLSGAFSFRGFEIRYGIIGPDGAPALVLLHGTPFSAHEWHRIAPWLGRHFLNGRDYASLTLIDQFRN